MTIPTTGPTGHQAATEGRLPRRRDRETKTSFKTTELAIYIVAVIAVMSTSVIIDGNGDNGSAGDYLRADRALFYIVLLTVGYMVSRGLAKAGSRDSHDD
jgi:hypothetical protein